MRKRIAEPAARPSATEALPVHVRAKKPPSPGRGSSPNFLIKWAASAFMGNEI
jgi:hypothetical protein